MRYLVCWLFLSGILPIPGHTSPQSPAVTATETSLYKLTKNSAHSQTITPNPQKDVLLLQFVSSESPKNEQSKDASGRIIAEQEHSDDAYLGAFGTVIPMPDGVHRLWIWYPNEPTYLRLTITVLDKKMTALEGSYELGCSGFLSEWSSYHLAKRLTAILNGRAKIVDGVTVIDLPNPQTTEPDPSNPHPDTSSAQCEMLFGTPKYYDLTVTTKPSGASVYVDSEFLGQVNGSLALKVKDSPVELLIRLQGYLDVAKSVALKHGPNDVTIVLATTKP